MNITAVKVIYKYEMLRAWETMLQTIISPVISTALYFVVFGSAIGTRIEQVEGETLQRLALLQLGQCLAPSALCC